MNNAFSLPSTAAGQRQNTSLPAYKLSQKKPKCSELSGDQLHATSKSQFLTSYDSLVRFLIKLVFLSVRNSYNKNCWKKKPGPAIWLNKI